MIFLKKIKADGYITREELRKFLVVLNPLAPHITSEMFEIVFGKDILDEKFPEYDENKTKKQEINLPIQINGKMKGTILINANATQSEVEDLVYASNKVSKEQVRKIIYVPGRIINFIV